MSLLNEPISIQPILERRDLRRFIGATREIYKDDPNWVQPLTFERMQHLDRRRNPLLEGIEIAWWVAYRGARPVGRISAQINNAHLSLYRDRTGHFGFLEAIDDPEIFKLLLGTAEIWLKQRGMTRVMGPFSLSINDECGLLVSGFDRPPYMMMPHGQPFYDRRLTELGYAKAKDLIAFEIDVEAPWPKETERLVERVGRMSSLRIRKLDMANFAAEIRLITEIFNDAWADNWGFIPFGEAEAHYMARTMRPLVDAGCFSIAEIDGEAVAMAVTLPNINEAIRDLDGRLFPFGWLKLLYRLKVRGVESWRMPLMGVRRHVQGTMKGAAAALGVMNAIKHSHVPRGVKRAELSWVLEDNHAIRQIIDAVNGKPYKTMRIYEKELA